MDDDLVDMVGAEIDRLRAWPVRLLSDAAVRKRLRLLHAHALALEARQMALLEALHAEWEAGRWLVPRPATAMVARCGCGGPDHPLSARPCRAAGPQRSPRSKGAGQGDAGAVGEVPVGRRVEDGEVGAGAHPQRADVVAAQRRRAAGGGRPDASAGVMPISRTASAMQKGIDEV